MQAKTIQLFAIFAKSFPRDLSASRAISINSLKGARRQLSGIFCFSPHLEYLRQNLHFLTSIQPVRSDSIHVKWIDLQHTAQRSARKADTHDRSAFHSSGAALTKEIMMEHDEDSKFERQRYARKALLTIFVCTALAALGAWLIQPEAASAKLHGPSTQPTASTPSLQTI
ncbi:hypothetical protein [Rhizobium hainanense]|nr:hypothetical protein [Rhizobium hainanense]